MGNGSASTALLRALLAKRQRQTADTPAPLDLLTWSILRRSQLKPGISFDLPGHLYLAELYEQRHRRTVVKKAGQMGVSELAVSAALWTCDVRDGTVLYIFPTATAVSDFSSARIGPAIEASPYLAQLVVSVGEGRRGADRVGLKRVRDRFLYLRGAQVDKEGRAAQLKSVDADFVILDELDEMDPRAPTIAEKRLGHSLMDEMLYISTPTFPNRGIDAEYQKSDQRRWFLTCGHCGHKQFLTINHVVQEWDELQRPIAWHGRAEGRAYCACEKCGKEIDRLGVGEWVPAHPSRDIVGYHLSKLFFSRGNLNHIVVNLTEVNETKRREAFNQDLGETFVPSGGKLTDGELDECVRNYALKKVPAERPVMGVDIGSVHNVIIRGPADSNGERPLRLARQVTSFEEIGKLIREYKVSVCVMDARPETTKARELQAGFRKGVVWLADYNELADEEPVRWDKEHGRVLIDRTRSLDETFSRFRLQQNTLPQDIQNVRDYYAQMKAPTRMDPDGRNRIHYVEDGPDHYAHAENYATAASLKMKGFLW